MKKPPDVICIDKKKDRDKVLEFLCLIEYAYKKRNKYLLIRAIGAIHALSESQHINELQTLIV